MSDWREWERHPRRTPPARGVKLAQIGATWWGKRWIEALEQMSEDYRSRLARGRTYARAGCVHDLEIEPGQVTARVTGSRPQPYRVSLRVTALSASAWDAAVAAMAKQALFAAELLAGRMPHEIDQAFQSGKHSLFPSARGDLATECSCPDWANPCKHVAATHYVLGEAFDKDPFLLFELRGRGRDEVLDQIRRARSPSGEPAPAPAADAIPTVSLAGRKDVELEKPGPPAGLRFSFDPPAAGALVQLGAPPSWNLEQSPVDLLGPIVRAAGDLARRLALAGDEAPGDEADS
jgi:uncharacterized Zn finger protein